MANYEMVLLRFNMDKQDQKVLFENLNSHNRAGHVKDILKEVFLGNGIQNVNKKMIKEMIESYLKDMKMDSNIDTGGFKNDSIIIEEDENDLLSAVNSIMRGA